MGNLQADLSAATEKPVRYPLPEIREIVVGTRPKSITSLERLLANYHEYAVHVRNLN